MGTLAQTPGIIKSRQSKDRTPKGMGGGELGRAWLAQGQARLAPDRFLSSILLMSGLLCHRITSILPFLLFCNEALCADYIRHFARHCAVPEMNKKLALP